MGYAGYYSTTALVPDPLTPLQEALRAVDEPKCLELLRRIHYRAAVCPTDEKLHVVKLDHSKVQGALAAVPGGMAAAAALGWQPMQPAGGIRVLALPKGAATMAHVRDIDEAARALAKRAADERRAALSLGATARVTVGSSASEKEAAKAALRAQLEADRRERAAAAPATAPSVAQPLPGAGGERPKVGRVAQDGCDC